MPGHLRKSELVVAELLKRSKLTSWQSSWSIIPRTSSGTSNLETSYSSSNCSPGLTQPLSILGSMICANVRRHALE